MGIKNPLAPPGGGRRTARSCHRHSAVPGFSRQSPGFDSFPPFFAPIPPGCSSWREGSWEGAEIKEREMGRGTAAAPGAHPAAPGLFSTEHGGNDARLALRSSVNSLLIPEIWEVLASKGGPGEGLKRAQGARAAKNPPPGITALPTGKTRGTDSQPFPHQKHGEMDAQK